MLHDSLTGPYCGWEDLQRSEVLVRRIGLLLCEGSNSNKSSTTFRICKYLRYNHLGWSNCLWNYPFSRAVCGISHFIKLYSLSHQLTQPGMPSSTDKVETLKSAENTSWDDGNSFLVKYLVVIFYVFTQKTSRECIEGMTILEPVKLSWAGRYWWTFLKFHVLKMFLAKYCNDFGTSDSHSKLEVSDVKQIQALPFISVWFFQGFSGASFHFLSGSKNIWVKICES